MDKEVNIVLLQFKVKNYKSIGEEVVLDMTAGKCGEHKDFLWNENGVEILPVASIYGSNASGKSNVISAFLAMTDRIFTIPSNTAITPFLFDASLSKSPTEFEVFVALSGQEYRYGFSILENEIKEEWLYERKLSKNELAWKGVFERNLTDGLIFRNLTKHAKHQAYSHIFKTEKKLSVLAFFGAMQEESTKVFSELLDWFIHQARDRGGNKRLMLDIYGVAEKYYQDEEARSSFVTFIREFDPNIQDIVVEKEEINNAKNYKVFTLHGENGQKCLIDIESDGTKKLLSCYYYIYFYLNKKRGFFIADELDSHLHPLILRRIVRMFHDKSCNKTGSQLMFSAHNLILLDKTELRRDEIWFTEKDEKGMTKLYSLAEFKADKESVRSDLNYGKHYLAGRFGAIPYE